MVENRYSESSCGPAVRFKNEYKKDNHLQNCKGNLIILIELAVLNLKNASIILRQHGDHREDLNMLNHGESRAQGLVEYALILMLVAIVVLVILALLGPAIGNLFSNVMYNL